MIPSVTTRNALIQYLKGAQWQDLSDTWEDYTTETWGDIEDPTYEDMEIYISKMPDDDLVSDVDSYGNAIAIFDTGGRGYRGEVGEATIQVMVRNTSYTNGYNTLQEIKEILAARNLYNDEVFFWSATSDIIFVKQDQKKRYYFTLNFIVYKNQI